jgi:hypothetical protein
MSDQSDPMIENLRQRLRNLEREGAMDAATNRARTEEVRNLLDDAEREHKRRARQRKVVELPAATGLGAQSFPQSQALADLQEQRPLADEEVQRLLAEAEREAERGLSDDAA